MKTHVFCTFLAQKCTILVSFPENLSYFISKTQKPLCFCNFPGARSNRSNPISYSFYLIGLLWSGDLRETSKLQNSVSFGSRLSLPKMEKTGRAQPALQCCPLHSLERDHTHLWSNIESKVQNKLKTHGFLHILAQKCTILVSFPENLSYFISKTQKTLCFCNFPGARSNRSNPISYSFYLTGLLWSGDLRNIQTAKQCLVWISFVFAQNGKNWSCSTCLAMLPTAQLREGSYSFVVKHWVKSLKQVENACFLHILAQKCTILVSFPENLSYFISKTQKTLCFCNFPGARSNRSNS